MMTCVFVADVDWLVDDDPGDCLVASRLSQRSVVGHEILRLRQQTVNRQMADVNTVTCFKRLRLMTDLMMSTKQHSRIQCKLKCRSTGSRN